MLISNSVLFNQDFTNSLKKVLKLDLDWDISISLAKTVNIMDAEREVIGKLLDELIKRFKVTEFSNVTLKLEDESKKEEFLEKFGSLMKQEFEIPLKSKLNLSGTKISTEDVLNIGCIVEGI